MKTTKRFFALILSVLMLITCCVQAAAEEEEEWMCPACGAAATGNFCSKCGEKKPEGESEAETWTCPTCGAECTDNFCSKCGTKRPDSDKATDETDENGETIRLDLDIAFEKNAYFSTYNVKLFIDGELITTMRHGIDYTGTAYVTPGKHVISFQEDSSSYPSEGNTIINISEPSLYRCEIHAKIDTIQITGERIETISEEQAGPGEKEPVKVDGSLALRVSIEFRKNGIFSQYDVDMYFDDIFIATLPHGKNYENTLLVSKGPHMITFCKSGSKSIRGTCSFTLDQDASFYCKIEAERNKVDVRNDKLSY